MKRIWARVVTLVCAAGLAACAAAPKGDMADAAIARVSIPVASLRIVPGTSTKADVIAALGPSKTIRFDSGFEVWLYYGSGHEVDREAAGAPDSRLMQKSTDVAAGQVPPAAEFVILFAPSGVVAKTRVRPYTPAAENRAR